MMLNVAMVAEIGSAMMDDRWSGSMERISDMCQGNVTF